MAKPIKLLEMYDLSYLFNPLFLLRKKNILPWKTNIHNIEIELTTRCSLACFNCDRSIRQAPSNEYMPLTQIQKFVDESITLNWHWKHIGLLGGEPTLHPHFFDVLQIINKYRKFNPHCKIDMSTNGHGKKVNEVLSKIPTWIRVWNSSKISGSNKFYTYNVAPIDLQTLPHKKFSKGCWITHMVGLGLSRYGYYPCGAGASVDRVFGFDIGIKKLASLTQEQLRTQRATLCRYCGHFKINYMKDQATEEVISKTWKQAYQQYKNKKPTLALY